MLPTGPLLKVKPKVSMNEFETKEQVSFTVSASSNLPYFVARTKNHMVPVYLRLEEVRGIRKVTIIRHIEGDIWVYLLFFEKILH